MAGKGKLHRGVVGAHPSRGGIETPPADIAKDETRFGAEARFTMGPDGRDTMGAGGDVFPKSKPHVDTEPYLRRPAAQGEQLPLGTDDAFKPHDPVQHFVRLKHPHLAENYSFEKSGNDAQGHQITVYHRPGKPAISGVGRVMHEAPEQRVGFLRWAGTQGNEDHAPGEIEGVSVHPEHRGAGLSTAMWDYAQAHTALRGSQEPVHSADRSTAGNHWAHFVGGAALPRTGGQDVREYFPHEWRH